MHLISHQVAREVKRQVKDITDPSWLESGDMGYFKYIRNGKFSCLPVELRHPLMGVYGRTLTEDEVVTYLVHQLERP